MTVYPYPREIRERVVNMTQGNFGLWYNKYIPLSENLKATDSGGDERGDPVSYYLSHYNQMRRTAETFLRKKHLDQKAYSASFPKDRYESITIRARLVSPLVTGIGESHPHEVSMVFDHNMGLPYIPASSVKGFVRFAHTYLKWKNGALENYVKKDKKTGLPYIDDESCEAIYYMFGNQRNRGKVIFLDAYPAEVPELHEDVMNPHYAPYYSEGKPPADYYNPIPIKFLTVARGTVFIFRAVAKREKELPRQLKEAFRKALVEEGVGAKTAVGYGRFEIEDKPSIENESEKDSGYEKATEVSHLRKWCNAFNLVKPNEHGKIGSLIDSALKELVSEEDKKEFARFVEQFMGKEFKKSKAKLKLEKYLI